MRPKNLMRPSAEITKNEVLVIDSRRLYQAGLARLLGSWADATGLTVKAASPDAPLDTGCLPSKCEMIIISVGPASIQCAEPQLLIKNLKRLIPEASLVIISDQEDAKEVSAAFHRGAVGFLPTSIEPELALRALSFIRAGGSFFPPFAIQDLALPKEGFRRSLRDADLTARQKQVFGFLGQGYTNKAIARLLHMSDQTVKAHARRIADIAAPFEIRAEAAPVVTMLRGAVRLGPSRSGRIPPLAANQTAKLSERIDPAQSIDPN